VIGRAMVIVKCQVKKQMLTSSKNRRLVARLIANEDKKERLEEVYCEDKITSSSACKVIRIWLAIGIQKYT
jgi:hypothetical protein